MKKKAVPSVLMLTFILLVSIFIASDVLAQLKPQRYPGSPQPTVQPQPIPSQTPTLSEPPKVTYFKINNDADTTSSLTVYLNNSTERASQYRASQRPDFKGAQWRSLIPAPQFTLGSGDGKKRVYFQVKNSMGQYSAVVSDTIALVMSPIVTSFKVISWDNAGEYYFNLTNARLNYSKLVATTSNSAKNDPTHLRISGKSDFSDARWVTYRSDKPVLIDKGLGKKTIYLKLKNTYGMSKVYTAAFSVPSRRDFIIYPASIKNKFSPQGFNCTVTPKDAPSRCLMQSRSDIYLLIPGSGLAGSRCDYTLFSPRQLNTGWVFKKFQASSACSSPSRGCYVRETPDPGTRQIAFKVHLWANAGRRCSWDLKTITIEGPGDAHWEEAFN